MKRWLQLLRMALRYGWPTARTLHSIQRLPEHHKLVPDRHLLRDE